MVYISHCALRYFNYHVIGIDMCNEDVRYPSVVIIKWGYLIRIELLELSN